MHICVCLHIVYACIRQETALLLSGTTGQTKQAAEQITFCVFSHYFCLSPSLYACVRSLAVQQSAVYVCVLKLRMKSGVSHRVSL